MPGIDNRSVWDKGIGPAAETIFSSSAPATMAGSTGGATNYNPGAWSQDQTAAPPTTTTPTSTSGSQPVKPAINAVTPAMGGGQNQQNQNKPSGNGPYAKNIEQAKMLVNQLQQKLQYATTDEERNKIRYELKQAVDKVHQWETANSKFI
jgi:hypothetical protein